VEKPADKACTVKEKTKDKDAACTVTEPDPVPEAAEWADVGKIREDEKIPR